MLTYVSVAGDGNAAGEANERISFVATEAP